VSTVPRSPATQARRELGLRLRQIRKTAGLTGQMLADATGQHFTRISRIENAERLDRVHRVHRVAVEFDLLCPQWLPAELEVLLRITARHHK